MDKLKKQMEFLIETEKLKEIFRHSMLSSGRRENDAEHSWSLCMYAIVLEEYADEGTDILKCIKMTLIHDLVEIYAGDTYLYDEKAGKDKAEREQKAADRLFDTLPEKGAELKALWLEFDENKTKEARFANILDRFQPVVLNFMAKGIPWTENNITKAMVLEKGKNSILKANDPIRSFYMELLDESERRGYL